jgi:hypothetical protein
MKAGNRLALLGMGALIGIVAAGVVSGVVFLIRTTGQPTVVDKEWLEGRLFPASSRSGPEDGQMTLERKLFKDIGTVYVSATTGSVEGFSFYVDSAYYGFVKPRDSSDLGAYHGVGGYFVYGLYDAGLYKSARASGQVFIYRRDDSYMFFDTLRNELFMLVGDELESLAPIRQ